MSIDADRFRRLEEVFGQVSAAPHAEQAALIDRLCGDDDRLRRDVESMLELEGDTGGFMAAPLPELLGEGAGAERLRALLSNQLDGAVQDPLAVEGGPHWPRLPSTAMTTVI